MPKIGSLWVWLGNNYTVIDAYNGRILLAEQGSGDWATQVFDEILGWLPLVSLAKTASV